MKSKKAFTLIELIAVLVILAILALIVTPLVLNIIKKARTSADKRSIDAYGRSVELAIADYLLDKGEFPTNIEQLTIEYTGDKVECETTKLNSDSSVYLAGCTVGGRTVAGYTYGKEEAAPTYTAYSVGDEVTYNNVNYYVIKDSSTSESSVTLLKAEPLTVEEVEQYGQGHINRYMNKPFYMGGDISNQVYNQNGYGGIAYYTSETCGYVNGSEISTGCVAEYSKSEIKYVIDAWAQEKVSSVAIEVRLLTLADLINNLGFELESMQTSYIPSPTNTPSWVYGFSYWTMSSNNDSSLDTWNMSDSSLQYNKVYSYNMIRPVIVLSKSVL